MKHLAWIVLALIGLALLFFFYQKPGESNLNRTATEKVLVQAASQKEECDPGDYLCQLRNE